MIKKTCKKHSTTNTTNTRNRRVVELNGAFSGAVLTFRGLVWVSPSCTWVGSWAYVAHNVPESVTIEWYTLDSNFLPRNGKVPNDTCTREEFVEAVQAVEPSFTITREC